MSTCACVGTAPQRRGCTPVTPLGQQHTQAQSSVRATACRWCAASRSRAGQPGTRRNVRTVRGLYEWCRAQGTPISSPGAQRPRTTDTPHQSAWTFSCCAPRGTLPGGACPPPRGAGWATRQGEAGCSVCSVLPAADEFMGACGSMGRRGARPRAEGRQRAPTPKVVGEDVPHPFLVWVRHVPVFRDSNPVVENEVPAAALPIQPQRQTDQDRRAYPKRQRRQQRKLRALHTGMRRREHTADENHLLWSQPYPNPNPNQRARLRLGLAAAYAHDAEPRG